MKTQNNNTLSLFASFLLVLFVIVIDVCPNAFAAGAAAPAPTATNTAAAGTAAPTVVPATPAAAPAPIAGPTDPMVKVCMVYAETPQGEQPEAYHLRVLVAAFGSEQVAKDRLIYSYTFAASGFTTSINPEQKAIIEKQPGIIAVNCEL